MKQKENPGNLLPYYSSDSIYLSNILSIMSKYYLAVFRGRNREKYNYIIFSEHP